MYFTYLRKRKEMFAFMNVKTAKKTTKRGRFTVAELQDYSLLALPVLLVFIFSYLPMFGIIIAFKNYRYDLGIFSSKWVGFDNFRFFFESDSFLRITWNTLSMNFLFIVLGTAASIFVAIMLFYINSRKATKVYQTMMITPHFVSWVIAAYVLYAFLSPKYGLLNGLRTALGMEKVDWYSEAKYWPCILVIANIWKTIGMNSVMYYASLMGIDSSMFEAAEIDGAGKVKMIIYIIIPSLVPIITILTIMSIGNIFRADFGLFYQLPRNIGLLYKTTDVIDTFIFRTMREIGDMGMSSAVGLMQSFVGLVLVLLTNYVTKKIDSDNALF